MPKDKPIVGVDLDGVIALESDEKWQEVKAAYIASGHNSRVLVDHFQSVGVDTEFTRRLWEYRNDFDWRIVTARSYGKDNSQWYAKALIQMWLGDSKNDYLKELFWGYQYRVVVTRSKWKAPELWKMGAKAMIDNDYGHLSVVPFVKRYAWRPYYSYVKPLRLPTREYHAYDDLFHQLQMDFYG